MGFHIRIKFWLIIYLLLVVGKRKLSFWIKTRANYQV